MPKRVCEFSSKILSSITPFIISLILAVVPVCNYKVKFSYLNMSTSSFTSVDAKKAKPKFT